MMMKMAFVQECDSYSSWEALHNDVICGCYDNIW